MKEHSQQQAEEHSQPQTEEHSQQQAEERSKKRTKGLRPSRRQQDDAEHLSELTVAKAVRTKEVKDFSKFEIEQDKVMDTLLRATSIIEKEMIKNLSVEKDTETIHRTVVRETKIS